MKLSVIIPIYNVEQYLRKCVDSVLNQDISNYEILLVDDGSPDACPQICDEYAASHSNINVIHQENGGLSVARNAGLKVAKGEYVCFLDSDDYWEPNVLSELVSQIERNNLDVLRFNFQNVNEHGEIIHPNKDPKRDVDYSEAVTDGETFLNERLGPMCYASQFIVKRSLIYNDGMSRDKSLNEPLPLNDVCLFKEGIYFEDTEWTPRMLLRAKRVASTPRMVYNYLWRVGSITLPTDPKKRKKVLGDKMKLLYGFTEQRRSVRNPVWYDWMTCNVTMGVLDSLTQFPLDERRKYITELRSMHIFPLSIKRERMRTHRMRIRLANISPYLYCWIMKIRKRI